MPDETPITFDAPSYLLFDKNANAALTTAHGNLAIFSTRAIAERWASSSRRELKVLPVMITPVTEQ
jgi:hypothetical protein